MSTRSGKRIHASIHEDVKSQRKSRRQKDNGEMDTTTISKRNNYVTYPKEDNLVETDDIDQKLPKRKRRTLNQHNHNTLEATDMNTTMVRETRSNKKINNITEVALESDRNIEVVNGKIKPKKSKKKAENKKNGKENIVTVTTQTKSKSKKKKSKRSLEAESNNMEVVESNDVHNQSNESVDSYHSANACSPRQINNDTLSLTPDVNTKADNGSKKNTPMDVSNAFSASPSQTLNGTFDKSNSDIKNSTFDNINISKENSFSRTCKLSSASDKLPTVSINSTYDKLDITFDKNSKSSLDGAGAVNSTFDKFNGSHISISSDQSNANIILNDTPMHNENSVNEFKKYIEENKISDDESLMSSDLDVSEKSTSPKSKPQSTPLKREGTFTIEGEDSVILSSKHKVAMRNSSPGSTPFPLNNKRVSKEKKTINLTRSIDKKTKSPRNTKVMFCSPVNNPSILSQRKSKIIKSNLKGSNKSFVFDGDESMSMKNQVTSNCKRLLPRSKFLVDDQQESVKRLSKPRTPNVKSLDATKKDSNKSSTKLPNFSALHRKQFAKMESLVDCQQRKAERARQLLAPSANLDRTTTTTKVPSVSSIHNGDPNANNPKRPDMKFGYTRFGFKLNTSVNPFNVTVQSKPKDSIAPSTIGATVTTLHRRQAAKKAASREKPSKILRISVERNENRTVIKGVRTNRRFELQMKARNLQLD